MNNIKDQMQESLREGEIKLLERVAEVLGENIETIYYHWTKTETIEKLVDALEKAW